ncbi:MAG TPA: hypothetical protein VF157_13760 [Chloroflexota bacterium]
MASSRLTLQLYKWRPVPLDVTVTPGDVPIRADQLNSACAL